jgi:hypothetical protein
MEKEDTTPRSDSLVEMEEGSRVPEVPAAPTFEEGFDEPALPKWRLVTLIFWYVLENGMKCTIMLILSSLCFGLFLSLLDTTIVATALYTIGVDLKTLGSANWVALAYTLSYLGCAVIFSRIATECIHRSIHNLLRLLPWLWFLTDSQPTHSMSGLTGRWRSRSLLLDLCHLA